MRSAERESATQDLRWKSFHKSVWFAASLFLDCKRAAIADDHFVSALSSFVAD